MAPSPTPRAERIRLQGFNNLTKTLSLNLYAFFEAGDAHERARAEAQMDESYGAAAMTELLRGVADVIDARVLSVSSQNYEPHGASALMLMSDEGQQSPADPPQLELDAQREGLGSVGAHLDKSHLCAHTYPDWEDPRGIASLRIDIEISTCGTIVPLRALDFVFERLVPDVAVVDYAVRGFTRDVEGRRVYLDHSVDTVLEHLDPALRAAYGHTEHSVGAPNRWHGRLMRTTPAATLRPGATPAMDADSTARVVEEMCAVYAAR